MKKLILGSQHQNTHNYHQTLNLPPSQLITSIGPYTFDVGHTSIQDMLFYENLDILVEIADEIYWAYPNENEFWDHDFYIEYIWWLKSVQCKTNKIKNFPTLNFDPYNFNKINIPVLSPHDAVFVGCSFTAGAELEHEHQRYANIVSNYFNLNCVNLAKGGGSNARSFEILSKLEFHENQLVILQLTIPERMRYIDADNKTYDIMFSNIPQKLPKKEIITTFNKQFLMHEIIKNISFFEKIAKYKNLKFVFWLIDYKNNKYSDLDQLYFFNFKSYIPYHIMQNYHVDSGTDGIHPGPESNKFIANNIIKFIEIVYN